MREEYKKESKIAEKTQQQKEIELMTSMINVKKELEEASKNFEFAEGDLIDYYTYQMKASRAKMDYIVKKAKEDGVALDMIEQIDIKYNKVI